MSRGDVFKVSFCPAPESGGYGICYSRSQLNCSCQQFGDKTSVHGYLYCDLGKGEDKTERRERERVER